MLNHLARSGKRARIVEAHGGKGVYISSNPHLRKARQATNYKMTLVAGDNDYVPVVNDLVSAGFIVHVVFWGHGAKELREASARFVSLDDHFDFLSRAVKT